VETETELRELLAARTLELCRVASVIGEEGALADHVEAWARAWFPPDEIHRLSHTLVLGRVPAAMGDSRPTVALFGHLDTVPPHPGDQPPRREGDEVIGLGSSDMKGGLALMQLAAERVNRVRSPYNLVFVFYEREEGPYAENGLGPLFEARPELASVDFALCLEPSDNTVQMGCCGALHATLEFEGRSAHSARPWQGENAIHKAGALLARLHARAPARVERQGLEFFEVMSATLANGGRARNVVPERFTLNLNYRFAPGKSVSEAQADVREFVGDAARVTFTDLSPSGPVFLDHPLVQAFLASTRARVEPKQAWTDVARLAAHGVPAVNFGPGHTAQAHQANERISLENLAVGWRLLRGFLAGG
jgi:succinyl-diaminopimelate desuccinylase